MSLSKMGIPRSFVDAIWQFKNRWLFSISGVQSTNDASILPPFKGARPSVSFNEIKINHLNEYVYMPGKPDWKTINIVFYDYKSNSDPIFDWIKTAYNPQSGNWSPSASPAGASGSTLGFKRECYISLYDGCGTEIERWTMENAYPTSIDWGDLDMSSAEITTVSVVFRYDRAYKTQAECSQQSSQF